MSTSTITCVANNHGPTASLYHEDPDGIRWVFHAENFPTPKETADYIAGSAFAANPSGVTIDAGCLLEQTACRHRPD